MITNLRSVANVLNNLSHYLARALALDGQDLAYESSSVVAKGRWRLSGCTCTPCHLMQGCKNIYTIALRFMYGNAPIVRDATSVIGSPI